MREYVTDAAFAEDPRADSDGYRCLGDLPGGYAGHRIALYESDNPSVAYLRSYRISGNPPFDDAARVECEEGRVPEVIWDAYHESHTPRAWRAKAEQWIRAILEAS